MIVETPGGSLGDAAQRDPAASQHDIEIGLISAGHAVEQNAKSKAGDQPTRSFRGGGQNDRTVVFYHEYGLDAVNVRHMPLNQRLGGF